MELKFQMQKVVKPHFSPFRPLWTLSRHRKASKTISKATVSIQSYGCLTAFGLEPDDLWEACELGLSQFDNGLGRIGDEVRQECRDQLLEKTIYKTFSYSELLNWCLWSCSQALEKAMWNELGEDTGLIVATTTGLTPSWEPQWINYFKTGAVSKSFYRPLGEFAKELSLELNHRGPLSVVSSACSAGTQALGLAKTWLEFGVVDKCLVVGAEQLCQLTESGFKSLSLVGERGCMPFNNNHNGICLSEAAAAICLSRTNNEMSLAGLTGYGCSSDAHSMTAPKPDGSGPARAMRNAMVDAGILSQDLSWVHAHGTGSLQNDQAEAEALKILEIMAPMSSTKGVHGHSLAASGILESILCVKAIEKQRLLPTLDSEWVDDKVTICTKAINTDIKHIIKNSLGFGGVNASVVLSYLGEEHD